ncbi:hypothetical protein BAE44_0011571 [Dichanthelium oligosanthes]|uniref:DAR GTPase 2, mitochondrial n=1 Tax=Dichanthelium oligosanthes TaxID=888268 RepID=A0A1E5VQL5_9POAL|nr:hypothetical protein BAE44_0011571 [Dichanthelium oligosanthes]
MAAAVAKAVSRRLGAAVRELSGAWYGRHMAAAERAIHTCLPQVDLVVGVRDAHVPASSASEPLRPCGPLELDGRRVVILNKADLADPSETELLSVVGSRVREIKHEKGKIKHVIVSRHPGETTCISGYKVASHPNSIYVLDTPGVLSPRFANVDSGPSLALNVVNLREEYRRWENLNQAEDSSSSGNADTSRSLNRKRQYVSDHTQVSVSKSIEFNAL